MQTKHIFINDAKLKGWLILTHRFSCEYWLSCVLVQINTVCFEPDHNYTLKNHRIFSSDLPEKIHKHFQSHTEHYLSSNSR